MAHSLESATFSWKFNSFFSVNRSDLFNFACRHRLFCKWVEESLGITRRERCMCIIKKICFRKERAAFIFISQVALPQLDLCFSQMDFSYFSRFPLFADKRLKTGNVVHVHSSCWKLIWSFRAIANVECNQNIGYRQKRHATQRISRSSSLSQRQGKFFSPLELLFS